MDSSLTGSHHVAPALQATIQVPLFLFLSQRHTLPPLHSSNRHIRASLPMPPSQPLDQATIGVVDTDGPLSPTDNDLGPVLGEVKFWEEDLRRRVLRRGCFAVQ